MAVCFCLMWQMCQQWFAYIGVAACTAQSCAINTHWPAGHLSFDIWPLAWCVLTRKFPFCWTVFINLLDPRRTVTYKQRPTQKFEWPTQHEFSVENVSKLSFEAVDRWSLKIPYSHVGEWQVKCENHLTILTLCTTFNPLVPRLWCSSLTNLTLVLILPWFGQATDTEHIMAREKKVGIMLIKDGEDLLDMSVVLEDQSILHDIKDFSKAVAVLSVDYPKELWYTFKVIQKVLMNIGADHCSARVHGLRNRIEYWMHRSFSTVFFLYSACNYVY